MEDITKYPNLERYFNHFDDTYGQKENKESLPYLIVWVRLLVEPEEGEWTDPTIFFEMDDDETEQFFSWGSNSRWKNVFWDFALNNIDLVKDKCLELAGKYGDPNVEEYLEKYK